METFIGILIPFIGTTLGSACVFFMKKSLSNMVQRSLAGFAAGVMVAASIWSLLIPAIEQSESMGRLSFLPAFIGFWIGILFLLLLDHMIPHLHVGSEQTEGPKRNLSRTAMMVLAVTLHNIPEGMAVGVIYAWRVIRQLRQQGRLPCPSVLLFRTSLRALLFLCRFVQRERVRAERFGVVCCPVLWNQSEQC